MIDRTPLANLILQRMSELGLDHEALGRRLGYVAAAKAAGRLYAMLDANVPLSSKSRAAIQRLPQALEVDPSLVAEVVADTDESPLPRPGAPRRSVSTTKTTVGGPMKSIFFALAILWFSTNLAQALSCSPSSFGARFNDAAWKKGLSIRLDEGSCTFGPTCYYNYGALHVTTKAKTEGGPATSVRAESGPTNGKAELDAAEPIIAQICAPPLSKQELGSYIDAMHMALEAHGSGAGRGLVRFDSVDLSRERLPNNAGEVFLLIDHDTSPTDSETTSSSADPQENDDDTGDGRHVSKKELLDAFVYFVQRIDTDASDFHDDVYSSKNDLWTLGFYWQKIPNAFSTEYKVLDGCLIERRIWQSKKPEEAAITQFDLSHLTGLWHWSRAIKQLIGDQVAWILTASGKNAVCQIDNLGKKFSCEDDISSIQTSSFERGRSIKALDLITSNYCDHLKGKPF